LTKGKKKRGKKRICWEKRKTKGNHTNPQKTPKKEKKKKKKQ